MEETATAQEQPLQASVWITAEDESLRLSQGQPVAFAPDQDTEANPLTIDVDETQRFQRMTGFGAALTDSAAWVIGTRMNPGQRAELLRRLFDGQAGIGLSYVRNPIGASDFSLFSYTYDDRPPGQRDPQLEHFSIEHDREYILPLLREIRAVNPDLKIISSAWSAPAWMKTNESLMGGSLRSDAYDSYAGYYVRYLQAYQEEGVPIDSVTPQNEPQHAAPGYPSMLMSASEQIDLIKNHLGPALANAGLATEVYIFDHNWSQPDYPIEVLNDPDAKQYVTGTAFHCYAGSPVAQELVHDAHPDKSILMTECTGLVDSDFGPDLVWAMQNLFIGAIRRWATGVILWNIALDENSGPQNGGCSGCRGVVTVDSSTGLVTFNNEYYALGQASLAARPGAYRIHSSEVAGLIDSVAFVNPDGSKGLLVLNGLPEGATIKVRWSGRSFSYPLPAQSVATFRWP